LRFIQKLTWIYLDMILVTDRDPIKVVGEPIRDYKSRLMGLEQDTLERLISLADQASNS